MGSSTHTIGCRSMQHLDTIKCIFYIFINIQSVPGAKISLFKVFPTVPLQWLFPEQQCVMTSPLRRVASRPLDLHSLFWLPWPEAGERQECVDGPDSVNSRKRGILSHRGRRFHSPEILCSYSHSSASYSLCCTMHGFSQFSRSSVYSLLLTLVWGFSAVGQTVTQRKECKEQI